MVKKFVTELCAFASSAKFGGHVDRERIPCGVLQSLFETALLLHCFPAFVLSGSGKNDFILVSATFKTFK